MTRKVTGVQTDLIIQLLMKNMQYKKYNICHNMDLVFSKQKNVHLEFLATLMLEIPNIFYTQAYSGKGVIAEYKFFLPSYHPIILHVSVTSIIL